MAKEKPRWHREVMFPEDIILRDKGFKIFSRKKGEQAKWLYLVDGNIYTHQEAISMITKKVGK